MKLHVFELFLWDILHIIPIFAFSYTLSSITKASQKIISKEIK